MINLLSKTLLRKFSSLLNTNGRDLYKYRLLEVLHFPGTRGGVRLFGFCSLICSLIRHVNSRPELQEANHA